MFHRNLLIAFITTLFFPLSSHAGFWTQSEIDKISKLSLNELKSVTDPSNKQLYDANAIKLGKMLFHENRMSSNHTISCASCHIEANEFTDNRTLAQGLRQGFRNTPSLLNAAQHNWFFADGAKDSLWAQALSSIENPAEQNFSRIEVLHFIIRDKTYRKLYEQIFKHQLPSQTAINQLPKKAGPNAKLEDLIAWKKLTRTQKDLANHVFVNIGKAIAAYVSTLKSSPTRFDLFVEELAENGKSDTLNKSEQRGLKLFISEKSSCSNCHGGPLFSNKEFHNIGTGIPGRDNGRSEVIESVIRDKFNCLGEFSDAKPEQCMELQYINKNRHSHSGAYKTPSLRGLIQTAPYMHDGRYKSLNEVIKHYIRASQSKPAITDLPPIDLSENQQTDIVNFLLTL
jgi:cytochrome c peroxidase